MFNEEIIINGNKLTRKYIESLNKEERILLIEPIFQYFRKQGFIYPDDVDKLNYEWERLKKIEIDKSANELFNNDNIGTFICKYFCKSFYTSTEPNKKNMVELFNDDDVLKSLIQNRLGIDWYKQKGEYDVESFPISFRQIIQGFRSSRKVPMISIFKPKIAKFIYEKYSNENDVVYDYSAGFGGRMLGAVSCNRNYIGVDPLTIPELEEMKKYFKFNCQLINDVSEEIKLEKESIDLAFSSPPYYNQEKYSDDLTQAYNNGEDYFYNTYWKRTLENINYMLKPGKYFIVNVKNVPKMVDMAKEIFTYKEEVLLRTVRSHLNKKGKDDAQKYESIYVFIK